MHNIFMDTLSSAYCIYSHRNRGNFHTGEVFDERTDWQPPQKARKAMNGNHFVAISSVLLVAGLTYLAQ